MRYIRIFRGLAPRKPDPPFQCFTTNRSPKNVRTKHFMFGGRFGVSQNGCGIWVAQYGTYFSRVFHQIKMCQRIGRKVTYNPPPKNEKIRGIFLLSGSELYIFSKIQDFLISDPQHWPNLILTCCSASHRKTTSTRSAASCSTP